MRHILHWLLLPVCTLAAGCSDAMLAPPPERLPVKAKVAHVLKGIGQPCPGCGGNGLERLSADEIATQAFLASADLQAMILWADEHPNACDPANLDGDSDDDDC